jgi:hypothetical protein
MLPMPRLLQPTPMPRFRPGGVSFNSGRSDSTEALARVSISFTGMLAGMTCPVAFGSVVSRALRILSSSGSRPSLPAISSINASRANVT